MAGKFRDSPVIHNLSATQHVYYIQAADACRILRCFIRPVPFREFQKETPMKRHPFRLVTVIAAALMLCARAGGAVIENPDQGWTPELSMKYGSISETVLSPDGEWIAYVLRKPVMEDKESSYRSHIWIVSSDGTFHAQYTRGDKSCSNPAFSPDGEWLTFTTSRSGKNQVWMMRLDGGEAEPLTEAEAGVAGYRWCPDGKRIAYTMRDPETETDKAKKDEKRDVILVDRQFKCNHLYVIPFEKDEDGVRKISRLTSGSFHIAGFDWSPDGRTLVFSHQPDPTINTGFLSSDISTVPSDSGSITPLVERPGVDSTPRYSRDGKWIAFTSHGGKPEPIGLSDLFIVSAQGGDPVKLAETPNRSCAIIDWSADGKTIYVSESIRTNRHVLAVPMNGKEPIPVTEGEGTFFSCSFDRDTETMTLTFSDFETPPDVYISSVRKFSPNRLTDIHKNNPRPPMGKTEIIRWTSTDGMEIEGLLTFPVHYREDLLVPLIVRIHGGPAGVFSNSFTGSPGIYMVQYFVQNGYAVLMPNPRGSTGYGKDFRYANFQDWGFGDFDDIMTGVDHVLEMGITHPDSLCVMGWSYGGYMTSFLVTKTDRFQAASMGAGLPNLISMVTTTDIPDYLVAHMGGEFWNDYTTYEKHSAMYRIKNVVTPTQVIHGAEDLRVPFTQGQEFYIALKRRNIPTEMIVYPRTPHGPREPKFLMDVSKRILKWFEKHLRNRNIEIE